MVLGQHFSICNKDSRWLLLLHLQIVDSWEQPLVVVWWTQLSVENEKKLDTFRTRDSDWRSQTGIPVPKCQFEPNYTMWEVNTINTVRVWVGGSYHGADNGNLCSNVSPFETHPLILISHPAPDYNHHLENGWNALGTVLGAGTASVTYCGGDCVTMGGGCSGVCCQVYQRFPPNFKMVLHRRWGECSLG